VTTRATVPPDARARARITQKQPGVVFGLDAAVATFRALDPGVRLERLTAEGEWREGGPVLDAEGAAAALLTAERTALNFLQRLSGVATLTARFVAAVQGTSAAILDTRKTTPGWRILEKYAVRCGGGRNHRLGLHDAVLIKDNHLVWLQAEGDQEPIAAAIAAARAHAATAAFVEVEVDSLDQLRIALRCVPDIILVDNLGPEALAEAVRLRDSTAPGVELEASGGVNLETVGALARTGVDRISVGALTHSAPALDIALDFDAASI
jgi:nicotinate-nucleotide pyrophosphorylase (carboxylating)